MRPKNKAIRRSKGEILFEIINVAAISLFAAICLFPFINMLANAFSDDYAIAAGKVSILPVGFQTESFALVINNKGVMNSLLITVFVTVVGTAVNMLLTLITAYPLSRKDLVGRDKIIQFIIITMLFNGGMIPSFLLVRSLGLLNTLWALIIPGAISTFNVIVLKTFFQNVPSELTDAATIDGCGNIRILFQIMFQLSLPAIATLTLFYAVAHWNSYFSAMLYIDDPSLYTLQVKLRQVLLLGKQAELTEGIASSVATVSAEALKAATIVFSITPILLVYPWLQKYFVKGVMIGAVKG